jgi:hypothetical protein
MIFNAMLNFIYNHLIGSTPYRVNQKTMKIYISNLVCMTHLLENKLSSDIPNVKRLQGQIYLTVYWEQEYQMA